ncbi:CsiV family protein [Thalassotalea marina]|uniref:Peptidoglycan-binding protein CsiV n=1 Tax=Thalassotalea marina TaxID=1673741 RepID=A0A919BMS6_9GAMM|nr:CsiV family protein [Thalassotalea marina]GHF97981.1 hypothetical protein GCM10017161_27940 [Thalassotalea marina]
MKIKQTIALLTGVFAANALAATSRWSGDWFEIEVILLSNLSDKNEVKEVFDRARSMPEYSRSLDILRSVLSPEISTLKQQLPYCDDKYQRAPLITPAKMPQAFPLLSLEQISAQFTDASIFERLMADEQARLESTDTVVDDLSTQDTELSQAVDASINTDEQAPQAELVLTDEELALVEQAEQRFSEIQLRYHAQTKPLSASLCAIHPEAFHDLNPNPQLYTYNGIPTDVMPPRIGQAEDLYSNTPYIIDRDSLELKDVFLNLRRSKNFRPLLHVGWRQQVFEENKSTPVKLYAGDNLARIYQLALAQYQQELEQEQHSEAALQQILDGSEAVESGLTPAQEKQQAKQQRLNQMFSTLDNFDENQSIDILNRPATPLRIGNNDVAMDAAPTPPIQPWYLDGFLNIFLVGNYLNIKADFSILNLSLAEQETLKLVPDSVIDLKPIRLSQQRRLISRETHYLDHPYMGLIVQIRRHDRPVKQDETTDLLD